MNISDNQELNVSYPYRNSGTVLTETGQVEGRAGEIVAVLDQPADHPAHRQDAEHYEGTWNNTC